MVLLRYLLYVLRIALRFRFRNIQELFDGCYFILLLASVGCPVLLNCLLAYAERSAPSGKRDLVKNLSSRSSSYSTLGDFHAYEEQLIELRNLLIKANYRREFERTPRTLSRY